ncbi:MAG: MFS transporter [Bacteroidota bacterium]|nr:MFS transporter [Bacteroidota bacterium]MDP4216233.1 MFS transporter [Bacteroidota bacterium]MDP4256769.1 MFS transporter [Bacteroidota bacterium]
MPTASKKVINGWAMYDWANSVYNLVITTTFFPIYFTKKTHEQFGSDLVPFLGHTFINSALYDYSLAAAYLIISILYPILTSIADTRGNKKSFMQFFCYLGATGCSMLYFFNGSNVWLGVLFFMLASMGYNGSLVFYNAYLPEIAMPEDQDRVSAKGYAYGYIGSVLMQVVGFVLVLLMKDGFLSLRLNFLFVGLWWAVFAQFTFRVLPKPRPATEQQTNVLTAGFSEIRKVFREIKEKPVLKRFLRGFFFYSMGVQTVMLASTLFGSKVLHLDEIKLIVTVVLIQLVAIAGAILMSRLSVRYGNIRVLMGVLVFWVLICVSAYRTADRAEQLNPYYKQIEAAEKQRNMAANAHSEALEGRIDAEISHLRLEMAPEQTPVEYAFYGLALAVGLVMGGIQSLSRSTYSKLMPETNDTASYFSYYDLTEKLAIVVGMFSFGFIEGVTGSMKNSLIFLVIFFVTGFVWLWSARKKQRQMNYL